jgi:hypothetical protein
MENIQNFSNTNIDKLLTENVINDMLDYLYSNRLIMKNKELNGALHVPICITPSPIEKKLFEKISFYQVAFNKLIDNMSRDTNFLKETLSKYLNK